MNTQEIKDHLADANESALTADGFDDALIGYCERCGTSPVALYDYDKCIEVLVKRDKMTKDDAIEFFEFNTLGAFVGEGTPMFAKLLRGRFILEAPKGGK
jgi:hypothetical protein